MKIRSILIILLFLLNDCFTQNSGAIQQISIAAPSLGQGKFNNQAEQSLAIYTPPSYNLSAKRFPVLYFLPGFGDNVTSWTNGTYQGFKFNTAMDDLINAGTINEMIVVVINGKNILEGAFYVNSPVTGNWEDFVINDVIPYIDNHYRTLASPESRALTGHSMGGFGALNLSMKHPDIFGIVYALSPGLFDKQGLKQHVFPNDNVIKGYINKASEFSTISPSNAHTSFLNYLRTITDFNTIFYYAYGCAFSPNTDKNAPYIDNPYSIVNGNIVVDSSKLQNFESGFGDLENKIKLYKNNLKKLKSINFEYGTNDFYSWIIRGNIYFSGLLDAEGIEHNILSFSGGHEDMVRKRIEGFLLPKVSAELQYDSLSTGVKDHLNNKMGYRLYNYPNPFNPTTNLEFSIPDFGFTKLKIYDVLGNEVATLINDEKPAGNYKIEFNASSLSSGIYLSVLDVNDVRITNKLLLTK